MASRTTIAQADQGGAVTVGQPTHAGMAMLKQYWPQLQHLLPSHVKKEAWYSAVYAALFRGQDPSKDLDLWRAADRNPESLMFALFDAARQGLEPGTEQYYLTPRPNRRAKAGVEVLGIRGYQGDIELIYRAGAVASVVVEIVREHDDYRYQRGVDTIPLHRFRAFAPNAERGPLVGVYAYGVMRDGSISRVVELNQDDIDRAKSASASAKSQYSPWTTDEAAMWLKGLALDTRIPTPAGWSTMEALRLGHEVFDIHGQPCRVTAKSEVKHLDCYRVTFANGSSIVCDAEHLWLASVGRDGARRRASRGWETYDVVELLAAHRAGEPITMPVTEPLDAADADLPVDPWLLGYWLGDGNRSRPVVTCNVDNQNEVVIAISAAGYVVGSVRRDPRSRAVEVNVRGLGKHLADAGVLGHKHVPAIYLRASARQRLALLRGLVDSDGTVSARRGRVAFYSTDATLTAAAAELARSLGEMVNVIATPTSGYGHEVICHRASWQPSVAPATLSAKLANYRPRTYAAYRSVKAIEPTLTVPTQCIAVDSPTRTYLAGDDMTPTHNTGVHRLTKFVPTSAEFRHTVETIGASAAALAAADERRAINSDGRPAIPAAAPAVPAGIESAPMVPLDPSQFAQPPAPEDEEARAALGPSEPARPAATAADLVTEFPAVEPTDGEGTASRAVQTTIARVLAKGGITTDADRYAIAGRVAGRTEPITSTAGLTAGEGRQVVTVLTGWQDAGVLDEQLVAVLAATAGDQAPAVGTAAWHDAGHPTPGAQGQVVTVPVLRNGDCGVCEQDAAQVGPDA